MCFRKTAQRSYQKYLQTNSFVTNPLLEGKDQLKTVQAPHPGNLTSYRSLYEEENCCILPWKSLIYPLSPGLRQTHLTEVGKEVHLELA